MTKSVLIINGPNLNLLGMRQPEIYGHDTLESIENTCQRVGSNIGLNIDFRQSNSESVIVDWIQESRNNHSGLIINAGAYTHTSIAILDALLALEIPIVEVHLSNINKRDNFRQTSYVSKAALGMICGFGAHGYRLALKAIAPYIEGTEGLP